MTARDDILRMMSEAGAGPKHVRPPDYIGVAEVFERFAALVTADFLQRAGQYVTNDASREAAIQAAVLVEREACAQIVIDNAVCCTGATAAILRANAGAIRARGNTDLKAV